MQREIIFRGKRRDNSQWVEGFLLDIGLITCYIDLLTSWEPNTSDLKAVVRCFEVDPETVGQIFNSKIGNIAIGDFVRVKGRKRISDYITEIVSHNFNGGFTIKENRTYFNDDAIKVAIIEVVGNRFDNPELLKP